MRRGMGARGDVDEWLVDVSEANLRIGLVYDDTIDRFGGIGLYVVTLAAVLRRRGHHVELLLGSSRATEAGGARVHSLARNVRVRFNGNELSMPAWSHGRRLDRALREGAFDVLHVQVPYSPLMAGRLLTRADPRCAVVGTYHVASERLLPRSGARLLRILKLRSAPRFDATVSVSHAAARFAAQWSRFHVDRVVPNMLDLGRVRATAEAPSPLEADIVFVGRLVPRKGVEQLINAVATLTRQLGHDRTQVAIIGDGPLRGRLERQVERLGIRRSVTFHGALDDAAKLPALAHARIGCFPSLYGESFGLVVLEALAAGADVVIAGDNAGYAELLNGAGGLVDPRNPEAFASQLRHFLGNAALRRGVGDRQREQLPRFDADQVVDAVLDVYAAALRGRAGRSLAESQGEAAVVAA